MACWPSPGSNSWSTVHLNPKKTPAFLSLTQPPISEDRDCSHVTWAEPRSRSILVNSCFSEKMFSQKIEVRAQTVKRPSFFPVVDQYRLDSTKDFPVHRVDARGCGTSRSCRWLENFTAKRQQSLRTGHNAVPLTAKHYAILGAFLINAFWSISREIR